MASSRFARSGPHHSHSLPLVAPPEILSEDFRELDSRVVLRTSWHVERLLLLQSVTSHAHMGHGAFHGRKFPNTAEDDTARALRLDPRAVKADRQDLIDEIVEYARLAALGRMHDTLTTEDGHPLLGIGTFRTVQVDHKGVLKGLFLGGLRDEPATRSEAERRFGVRIGYGQCYLVNKRVMHDMGLSGEALARQGHADDIERFRHIGLIVDEPGDDVSYMYIRHHTGPGASDDAAIVIAGKLHGLSAAIGVFLADAVDTLEKYATRYGDQDSEIGHHVEENCKELDIGRDAAIELAYLAAAPEGREDDVPDSSLRHMLQIDRKHDLCPLESHLLYVSGRPCPEVMLDRGQCSNLEFYRYIEDRLAEYGSRRN